MITNDLDFFFWLAKIFSAHKDGLVFRRCLCWFHSDMSPIHKTNYTLKSILLKGIFLTDFKFPLLIGPIFESICICNEYICDIVDTCTMNCVGSCSLYFYQIVTLCRTISVSSLVKHFEIDDKFII